MNIVFLNQYYPPDVAPTGVMLQSVVDVLVSEGHEVTVLCAAGGYANGKVLNSDEESLRADGQAGVDIVRLRAFSFGRGNSLAKLMDYASYYVGVAWRLFFIKADLVVALTTPPYLSVLARLMTKVRRGMHGHWVMDLYPDVMFAHGMIDESGFVGRVLKKLASFGFGGKRCAGILSLGPDMERRCAAVMKSGSHEVEKSDWVPLWSTADEGGKPLDRGRSVVVQWREQHGWSEGEVVFLYSGNMGLGHRFGEFLRAASRGRLEEQKSGNLEVEESGRRFVFTGGGRRKTEVEEFVEKNTEAPVEVGGYVDMDDLAVHLASADVHLASMEPSWDGTMVPSKIQGIFASGRPVIFVGSGTSSIGHWILDAGAGWVVAPNDDAAMARAVNEAMDAGEREKRGAAAYTFSQKHFQSKSNAKRVAEFFVDGADVLKT